MKKSILLGAALAILGLAAAPITSEAQTSTTTTSTGYVQTSKMIGTKVKTAQGEEVGVVKDVVLERSNGCMAYTVLSTGGTGSRVTGTSKMVAVPWSVYSTTSDPSVLTVRIERDRIYNAPVFEYSRIDEYASSGYINNVYSYYGVSASVGVSGTTTTTTGATTSAGVSAQTGASVSPTASASPTGTVSATASPSATASVTASATATASPSATASAPPKAAASPRATRGTASATPSSTRHHVETAAGEKAESAESATSPSTAGKSEGKKSKRHATEGTSTAEPSATPQEQE